MATEAVWLSDANFPLTSEARTMHLNIAEGEVANRVLCVGHLARAARLTQLFDHPSRKYANISKRGFAVYTGTFKNVPVSIIGTGMGPPMTDFVIRECRRMVKGKMAFVRLGTCGLLQRETEAGTMVCSSASRMVSRNPDFTLERQEYVPAYCITKRIYADSTLLSLITNRLEDCFGTEKVKTGLDFTSDSFYDAQGRYSPHFSDYNDTLIPDLLALEPTALNFQMETFVMYHLASISKGSVIAASTAIGLINREKGDVLSEEDLREKEIVAGLAILQGLVELELDLG